MTGKSNNREKISTGVDGLDPVLDGLRIGDNVVWRTDDLDDYHWFVQSFVTSAVARDRSIIYLRFGRHEPLVEEGPGVRVVNIDALDGFEAFTRHVYQLITDYGTGAFYVFDCLSDLLSAWATDYMVGNFFRVICPRLYELDTVAYFALHPRSHSHITLARIRETTQVMLDVRRVASEMQVQPVKVHKRHSPTMFLPHRYHEGEFAPVVDSSEATRLQTAIEQQYSGGDQHQLLDYWDRLFLNASREAERHDDPARAEQIRERVLRVLISRDERILDTARRYLTLEDLLAVRARMIGSGYIGGKAVGMLLSRSILLNEAPDIWSERLEPHDSWHLGSDVYYSFLVHNGLWPNVMRQRGREGYFSEARVLRERMLRGEFPEEVRLELGRVLDHYGQYPLLVRSSSLLEDGYGNAFAGKYESVFCVNQGSPEARLAALEQAIRRVYASTMSDEALSYRRQRGLAEHEEPMALLLQRVNGRYHDRYYFPDGAGVGVSRNVFVWDVDMDPAAGMVRLVMGLGTRAVDRIEGDHACVVALDWPEKRPFRNPDEAHRFAQHQVDVLDIERNSLRSLPLRELAGACPQAPFSAMAEFDRQATERARQVGDRTPVWRLTFRPLLRNTDFVALTQRMLQTLERAYGHPVEVEFTLHRDSRGEPSLNPVQCRPLSVLGPEPRVTLPERVDEDSLLFASRGHFMGGNMNIPVRRIIHVDAARYSGLSIAGKHEVARLIGDRVRDMADPVTCPTMLIGPGRWGTGSPELGVPVGFSDISRISVLVEVAEMGSGMVPDLSFGSHFFQDLVESGIAYVALFPGDAATDYRPEWLQARQPLPARVDEDPDISDTVRIYDVSGDSLHVLADVVRQRLLCCRYTG